MLKMKCQNSVAFYFMQSTQITFRGISGEIKQNNSRETSIIIINTPMAIPLNSDNKLDISDG